MKLRWSRELSAVCDIRDELTADEALDILTRELLGDDYYIVDPLCPSQANVVIVKDILKKYSPRRKKK